MIILIFCTKQLHSNMRQATCLKDEVHVFCFSIDENKQKKEKKGVGGSGHEFQKIKKNPNHDSRKLKFAIFENFTNNGESIRDIN